MTTETCNQLDTFLIDGKPLGELHNSGSSRLGSAREAESAGRFSVGCQR